MPFDFLLRSLARQYGNRAACVVLSGTGKDGSAGLQSIKAQGGIVAVQDPAEEGYDGMPRNAIETGMADFVLPLASIPDALSAYRIPSADTAGSEATDADPGEVNVRSLPDILELLRVETGHDLALYKSGTLGRRIGRRMAVAGLRPTDMDRYHAILQTDRAELEALAGDLLIHVTSFFRDSAVFDVLAGTFIPELVQAHQIGQPLRVWVAGCSTGEETYSLAMLFLEQIEAAERPIKLQVFASDVDAEAIRVARDGAYPSTIAEFLSPERLARFFVREDAGWRASPDLRAAIVFTVQDVLADPPFAHLDMVSCRNLLIYLRPDAQARVIEAFHFALRDGGILLLGSAESPPGAEGWFEVAAKAERIYRRIGRTSLSRPGQPPRPQGAALVRPGEERRIRPAALSAALMRPAALAELGRRLVMETYAPASVLVDTANTVLFSLGPTDRYLRLPPGHATHDLLAMARPGLRGKLRAALQAAREGKAKALDSGRVVGDDGSRPFSLAVYPVAEAGEAMLLVCFLDADRPERGDGIPLPPGQVSRVAELERELDATRAELQRTVRDLELSGEEQRAINEEALSVNEEYQSTNEEMAASKEELQSLNEELTAVNSQLQEALERQRTTSDDLQNVLYSTNVATLFLDLDGRIRFFTPAIKALFAIIPSDVGRKLTDFAALAPDDALTGDVKAVQDWLEPLEREIEAANGTWFRRRILPYRTGGGRVEGVVITFTDITARKAAGRALEAAKMEAEAANAAKSRFLAAASHDLRQPLQTLALLQALLAETVTGEKAKGLVARQNTTLGTVTGMLDALLDINEIEAGAVQPDVSAFAIDGLLERLRGEFTYHAEAKAIQLRVVPCGQQVRSDPKLLEQMVRNLLSNAIKYTPEGRVLLGCRRHGGALTVEVWDTGIGIQDTDLAAIFEEYYQVGNAARQRSRGLGLGLSIVKRLGDLLGHPVRVLSRFGHGSGFSIELPRLALAEAARLPADRPEIAGSAAVLRILVVEDDPDLAEMLGELLRNQGHQITTAPDGPRALECVARSMPDLVLADYNLPDGPNGLELAGTIRAAAGRALPVIILTGDISSATLRAVAQGGCAVLSKPVGLRELRQAIARVLMAPDTGLPVIFVVDDDDGVRGAIMEVLESDGRTVAGFPSGEAFLQAFRPGVAACLLIDAALPGVNGIDLLEQLRAAGHGLPAIVITGQSDVPMAIRAMKAGASDFIEKPVNRPDLLASVARALERSRDAAKLAAWHEAAAARVAGLTPRQRETMAMVLAGHPSKNIAADLGISQRTVENHRASIMHRTGTASLPALARLALAASSNDVVVATT
jgi:two-component system CheB/CheR fusion protein